MAAGGMTTPQHAWYEGNYQAYIEDLKKRKGPDADQPHRIAYKKLVRA
jgi:energy-dependent translational throttle protein EttA